MMFFVPLFIVVATIVEDSHQFHQEDSWNPNCTYFCDEIILRSGGAGERINSRYGLEMHEDLSMKQQFYTAFCASGVCVIFPNFYNKFKPPKPRSTSTLENPDCVIEEKESQATKVHVSMDPMIDHIDFEDQAGELSIRLNLGFQWSDPRLDLCVCTEVAGRRYYWDLYEVFLMGNDLERFIWKPDLYLWNSKDFRREGSLSLLNDIWVRQPQGMII